MYPNLTVHCLPVIATEPAVSCSFHSYINKEAVQLADVNPFLYFICHLISYMGKIKVPYLSRNGGAGKKNQKENAYLECVPIFVRKDAVAFMMKGVQ